MNESAEHGEYSAHMTSVVVIGDYSIRVTFSDSVVYDADLSRHFVDAKGKLLGTPEDFALVKLDEASDVLLWPHDEFYHEHGELLYETYLYLHARA